MYYDHKIKKQDYELIDGVYKLKKAIAVALLFCAFLLLPMQTHAYTVTLHRTISTPFAKTSGSYHLNTKTLPSKKEKASISTQNTASAGIVPSLHQKPAKTQIMSHSVDSSSVTELICNVFGKNCKIALAIAKAESGLRCDAIGDGSLNPKSYGLFQIRAFWNRPPPEKLLDCYENIKYAHEIFNYSGWSPWSAYTNGSYKNHL
jgi:hypothetical protein